MKKGCQCVDCEHRDYCNKRNKGGVVQCINYNKGKAMTEQDWIQTATTEQLAEWIIALRDKCVNKFKYYEYRFDDFPCTKCNECDNVVEWLKQPHTVKE